MALPGAKLPTPVALTPPGCSGCPLYVTTPSVTIPFSGATLSLPIANDPALVGAQFFTQAFVTASGWNPASAILSDAGDAVIGGV